MSMPLSVRMAGILEASRLAYLIACWRLQVENSGYAKGQQEAYFEDCDRREREFMADPARALAVLTCPAGSLAAWGEALP